MRIYATPEAYESINNSPKKEKIKDLLQDIILMCSEKGQNGECITDWEEYGIETPFCISTLWAENSSDENIFLVYNFYQNFEDFSFHNDKFYEALKTALPLSLANA